MVILQVLFEVTVEAVPVRKHWRGKATVTVGDDTGNLISGATVTGDWEFVGAPLGSTSATTDELGDAILLSSKRRAVSGDSFCFTVTNVSLPGATYDPGSTPPSGCGMVP